MTDSTMNPSTGADLETLKRGWLYFGHHGWPAKKVLGCRWFKKTKITLETISFGRIISISIFKFSPFLHITEAWWWNLINFPDFTNAFIRNEKNHSYNSQWE